MSHTVDEKVKLLGRARRIRGQVEAIERAFEQEKDCSTILQTIAACRGAIDGLMAEVMEGHIRLHVAKPDERPNSERAKATQVLINVIRSYLK